jgi:large subunit ribosomal protein L30
MKNNPIQGRLVAIVRIRGRVNVRRDINETLDRLRLKRVNNCTVIKANDSNYGMIKACSNYVAYGEVDKDTLKKLVENGKVDMNVEDLLSGKYDAEELKKKLPFRLHPPRHGYKSTKRSVNQGGSLGYMGQDINKLIQRMVK